MDIILKNHNLNYVIQELLKVFIDDFQFIDETMAHQSSKYLMNQLTVSSSTVTATSTLIEEGIVKGEVVIEQPNVSDIDDELKSYHSRLIKRSLYELMEQFYDPRSQWGILTGMRPVKVVHRYLAADYSPQAIKERLINDYKMHEQKAALIVDIALRERPLLDPMDTKKIDLYISIPFCLTRCNYCSFPSNILDKKRGKVDDYLEALIYELQHTIMLIKQHDFIINSIYIGGGTPSTLTEQQLQKLLAVLKTSIDLKALQEFTFEAGRPNTINAEKLKLLKTYQVDRICLNPQTMDNAILEEISRGHTAEDIIETYRLIQQYNFKSINMDLIVGLPQQQLTTFQTTLSTIKALAPENITIHSLAIKRGSYYNKEDYTFENEQLVEQMLDYAYEYLSDTYHPYYLYRQKNILANLENVGFAKEGYASVYNVRIIEEKNSIIACGAGATSKFSYPDRDRFDRVPNIKGLEQYMARVEEMVERKQQAFSNII